MAFDVIGDVHGQYDKLVGLLKSLGYRDNAGAWRHPERTAVFVGDLIDRGPKQLATIDLVRAMVDVGSARCIMGNHEFNAIAWATPDPKLPGEFLRHHGKPGNWDQHRAFLSEMEGTPRYAGVIAWFKTLPLWLDFGGLRIVHACWHQEAIDKLRPLTGDGNTVNDNLMLLGSRKGHWAYEAIEVVCKGPEKLIQRTTIDQSSLADSVRHRYIVRLKSGERYIAPRAREYRLGGSDGCEACFPW
jgi:Calcineurin-like phosphoesterase